MQHALLSPAELAARPEDFYWHIKAHILFHALLFPSCFSVFTMCRNSWMKHLQCGHLGKLVIISTDCSNSCPSNSNLMNEIRGQEDNFCLYCQENLWECHKVSIFSFSHFCLHIGDDWCVLECSHYNHMTMTCKRPSCKHRQCRECRWIGEETQGRLLDT